MSGYVPPYGTVTGPEKPTPTNPLNPILFLATFGVLGGAIGYAAGGQTGGVIGGIVGLGGAWLLGNAFPFS